MVERDGLTEDQVEINRRCGPTSKVIDRLTGECRPSLAEIRNDLAHGAPFDGFPSAALLEIARDLIDYNGRGLGRIRLQQIGDVSTDSLLPFVQGAVERGAMVHTDGWRGYAGLAAAGYQHQVTVLSGGSDPAHEVMPRVHLVASLLKRWLIGTHQGGVQHQHLDYYLDEFTFRFNRRRSKARGLLFHRLAQQALAVGPAPYNAIVKPPGSSGSPATGQ